jgi:hypothetical protein
LPTIGAVTKIETFQPPGYFAEVVRAAKAEKESFTGVF